MESILNWATVRHFRRGDNPARWRGHLDQLLPMPGRDKKVEHHAALPFACMLEFMQKSARQEGTGARSLSFLIPTAARSGEVRGATRGEIDIDTRVWSIPGARMKAGRDHRVPLSDAAWKLLPDPLPKEATALLFPAPRGGQLSDMTLTAVMRRMEVNAVRRCNRADRHLSLVGEMTHDLITSSAYIKLRRCSSPSQTASSTSPSASAC